MTNAEQMRNDLVKQFENYAVTPNYIQMQLAQFRQMVLSDAFEPDGRSRAFLEEVKDIPENAIVVITPERLSLLVDEEGHLLSFR